MAVTIEVKGAKELISKLTTLEQMKKVQGTILSEADNLKEQLMTYPRNAHGPNPLLHGKGEKQNKVRRGFFWHLKNGGINVPYGRSGSLGGGWIATPINNGWGATVSNNISYNSLVQGPDQTGGHARSNWLTVDKAAEQNEAGIIARITQALEEEVADVG